MKLTKQLIFLAVALAFIAIASSCSSGKPNERMNKPLITGIFTADPSAHVFEKQIYIYPSHDLDKSKNYVGDGDQYDMEDYHVFSMKNVNADLIDQGEVLNMKDVPWVSQQMWAPDAAFKNGTYYLYFPAKDKQGIFRIGVASGPSPVGPFMAESEPIEGSYSIDPCVFQDADGKAYMIFGGLWGGQLERWQTGSFNTETAEPAGKNAALGPRIALLKDNMKEFDGSAGEIKIVDEAGKPLAASDNSRRFFEGAWLHKYKGMYYLSYSTGDTHYLVYATSKDIYGPYTYRGKILDPVKGWTTHHSIVEVNKKWYMFYHDSAFSNRDHLRSIKFTQIFYAKDGSIEKAVTK